MKLCLVHLYLKNGGVYTPEDSCMKGTSVRIKNIRIKQLCNSKVRVFNMVLYKRETFPRLSKNGPRASTNEALVVQRMDNVLYVYGQPRHTLSL